MKAYVDPEICIGCTLCTNICSEVFKMQVEKAIVYKEPIPHEFQECVQQAAEECPVQAIIVSPDF